MKRSDINKAIKFTLAYFTKNKHYLPKWANWQKAKWKNNIEFAKKIYDLQLGWDITDFGSNNFKKTGLTLFSLRNGSKKNKKGIQYAEKLMLLKPGQSIPYHFHKSKKEDIINKFGGVLELKFYENNKQTIDIEIDKITKKITAKNILKLNCGQSVYIFPNLVHSFKASDNNTKPIIVGEISSINDDDNDNFFPNKNIRFNEIIEDEKIIIPLWKDLSNIV